MASFSLTEKLAVTGAFLAMVALAVGTEDDPGLIVTAPTLVKNAPRSAWAKTQGEGEASPATATPSAARPSRSPSDNPEVPIANPAPGGLPPNPVNMQPVD